MFLPGTKIEVIASSETGKGAKLRKGSLGYISGQGSLYKLPNLGLITMPARLVVTRFGKETKRRIEHKWVQVILPITPTTKHPLKQINSMLQKSQDSIQNIRRFFEEEGVSVKKVPSIIALPTTNESDYSDNINELKAWTSSLLFSGMLHRCLFAQPNTTDSKQTDKLKEVLPEIARDLYNVAYHPKALYTILDKFEKDNDFDALINVMVWFRTQQMLITKRLFKEKYKINEPVFLTHMNTASLAWIKHTHGINVPMRSSGIASVVEDWTKVLKAI